MTIVSVEKAVKDRYGLGAETRVAELCCPTDYDPQYLEVIPHEVLDRDYGCGDPSRYLKEGETVLDLGSGTGKICFIAAQVVGETGRVIGIDMTPEMLAVARHAAPRVASSLGFANVEFRLGRIQDLKLDLDLLEDELVAKPVGDVESLLEIQGRSDELVPDAMQKDPELWSGCISGALTEEAFFAAFEEAGFHGLRILVRQQQPWQAVNGIEFRSVTVEAFKRKKGPCLERNQAVIYKGPFKEVLDDDDHRMERGLRYAVCDKTYNLYRQEAYRDSFEFLEPLEAIPLGAAEPFDCSRTPLREPRETKGRGYDLTSATAEPHCGPEGCC